MRIADKFGSYELEKDLDHENTVADYFTIHFGWLPNKLAKYDHIDFRMEKNNKTVGWLEVRKRNICHSDFKEIFVSAEKWRCMALMGIATNCPVYFVILFNDGAFIVDVSRYGKIKKAYAKGRGNCLNSRVTDTEEVVLLEVSRMKRVDILDFCKTT